MKQTIKTLKGIFWGIVGGACLFFAVAEFVLMDIAGGVLSADPQLEFICQSVMVLATLVSIYLSLRLFKVNYVKQQIMTNPLEAYMKWSIMRIALLEAPLLLNIAGYLFFMNGSFAWLATILLLALPFVYPTEERYINEVGFTEEK